jgi:hypothetical protein
MGALQIPIGDVSRGGKMPRSTRPASTAIVAAILTSAFWHVGAAAETDHRARSAATQTPNDACSLLTKQDAAAALGEAVSGPKALTDLPAGPGATVSSCEYTGSGLHQVQLNLTHLSASSVPMYRAMCAEKKSDDLSGLGDVACWYNAKHEELHALKGTRFISVELRRSGDPAEAIKGVMKKALDRLR